MEGSTDLIRRRSVTLLDQLTMVSSTSSNLRDLLLLHDDNLSSATSSASAATGENRYAPITAGEKRHPSAAAAAAAAAGKTLLDIIMEDHSTSAASSSAVSAPGATLSGGDSGEQVPNGTPWRSLRDRLLLLRRTESAPTSTSPNPNQNPAAGDMSDFSGDTSREQQESEEEEQPVRVSLMALLEQTDRHWTSGAHFSEGHLEENEEGHVVEADGLACVCCVCMVRRKGAAFIPCGHTFCRRCSRELHVSRGTCPLCNAVIGEVLDIF